MLCDTRIRYCTEIRAVGRNAVGVTYDVVVLVLAGRIAVSVEVAVGYSPHTAPHGCRLAGCSRGFWCVLTPVSYKYTQREGLDARPTVVAAGEDGQTDVGDVVVAFLAPD